MKTYNLFFAFTILLVVFSCDKSDETPTNDTQLQDDEVVDLLSGAILNESAGILSEVAYMAEIADTYQEKSLSPCEMRFDTLVTRTFNGTRITSNYTSNWGWQVLCNNAQIPDQLTFTRTTQGDYATQRLTSEDQANSSWLLDNLLLGGNFVLSGQYERMGSQESLVREMNTFTSTITIELTTLTVDKITYEILSGAGTFRIIGESSAGDGFSYAGTLTFLGDQQATLVVNGNEYNLNWN